MSELRMRDVFDNISPIDYRYWDEEVAKYLSENAFTRYKLRVELALVRALRRRGICSETTVHEVEAACKLVTTRAVYEEERRIHHDILALVNCIRANLSNTAKPVVHRMATSYDIVDTANAARYKDVVEQVLIPSLINLERMLIEITLREADTVQVGRTHGQHAVPITFGFAMAEYVSRLGGSIVTLQALTKAVPGKFSGAVGAYNASSMFFNDPEAFEEEVLVLMGLIPAEHSTQIVPPEALMRLFSETVFAATIMGNLGDDGRNLQRTEIGEVGEPFEEFQVGSTAMPQKQNPINFENVKSMWKIVAPRLTTLLADMISDHQRDLTNSASARTYGEIFAYTIEMAKRLTRVMKNLTVNRGNMERNLKDTKGGIAAEPLQILLSAQGHLNAHEEVRQLARKARSEDRQFEDVVIENAQMQPYLEQMTPYQRTILANPSTYFGIAPQKARNVANHWKKQLGL